MPESTLFLASALALALTGCATDREPPAPKPAPTPPVAAQPDRRPVQPIPTYAVLPDPQLTPGAVLAVTKEQVCAPGYAAVVAKLKKEVARSKAEVYQRYGIKSHGWGEYQINALVPLELGGSAEITNLFPLAYGGQPWNAMLKDRLDDLLVKQVCSGEVKLDVAQAEEGNDWTKAYTRQFGKPFSYQP